MTTQESVDFLAHEIRKQFSASDDTAKLLSEAFVTAWVNLFRYSLLASYSGENRSKRRQLLKDTANGHGVINVSEEFLLDGSERGDYISLLSQQISLEYESTMILFDALTVELRQATSFEPIGKITPRLQRITLPNSQPTSYDSPYLGFYRGLSNLQSDLSFNIRQAGYEIRLKDDFFIHKAELSGL